VSKLAALDLGSNSFHLLSATYTNGQLIFAQRIKDKVQMGAGLDNDDNLSQRSINRGLMCLKTFHSYLKENEIKQVVAVATNTLRHANNRDYFIKSAEEILGFDVRVISGEEEASLIFKAVQNENQIKSTGLAIDIGGGSTEFAIGSIVDNNFSSTTNLAMTESLEMGCVSYYRRFFADGKIYKENINAAIKSACLEIEPFVTEIKIQRPHWIAGTSGSVQSIALIAHHLYGEKHDSLTLKSINRLEQQLIALKHVDKIDFQHLEKQRRSILPSGLCILKAIFMTLELEEIQICQTSLCEGLLYELCEQLDPVG